MGVADNGQPNGSTKSSRSAADPPAERIDKEMQRVMMPFLQDLSEEFRKRWPHLEPELVLMLWICERHRLAPPTGRLDLRYREREGDTRPTCVNFRRFVASANAAPSKLAPARPSSASAGSQQRVASAPAAAIKDALPQQTVNISASQQSARSTVRSQESSQSRPYQQAVSLPPAANPVVQQSRPGTTAAVTGESPLPPALFWVNHRILHRDPTMPYNSAMSTAKATALTEVECRSPHVQPVPIAKSKWSSPSSDGGSVGREASTPDCIPGRPESTASQSTRCPSRSRETPNPETSDLWTTSPSPDLMPEDIDVPRSEDIPTDYHRPEDYTRTPANCRMAPCLRNRLDGIRETSPQMSVNLRSLKTVSDDFYEDVHIHTRNETDPRRDIHSFAEKIAHVRQGLRGRFIRDVPLLSLEVVSEKEQFWLTDKAMPATFSKGDIIVEEGQLGDDLYVIESGTCVITKRIKGEDRRIADIKSGNHFGELAVMYDMPRAATVTARTGVKVLKLSRAAIFSTVCEENVEKMKFFGRMQLFGTIPLLAKLEKQHKMTLIHNMRSDEWPAGKTIIRAGQRYPPEGRRLYFVENGACETIQAILDVKKAKKNQQKGKLKRGSTLAAKFMSSHTGRTEVGSSFGMYELLYNCPHLSTVHTVTPVTTLSISFCELERALGAEAPRLFDIMRKSLRAQLLRQSHEILANHDEEELLELMEAGFKRYKPWEVIIRRGDRLGGLLMLEEGTCLEDEVDADTLVEDLTKSCDVVEHNRPGATFGTRLTATDADTISKFSVVSITECTIVKVPTETLERLALRKTSAFDSQEGEDPERASPTSP